MSEFDKAKERYEKKKAKATVTPIKKESKPERDSFSVVIRDGGAEHVYVFELDNIKGTRLGSQRNSFAYQRILEDFITKEFGRWRLRPTH